MTAAPPDRAPASRTIWVTNEVEGSSGDSEESSNSTRLPPERSEELVVVSDDPADGMSTSQDDSVFESGDVPDIGVCGEKTAASTSPNESSPASRPELELEESPSLCLPDVARGALPDEAELRPDDVPEEEDTLYPLEDTAEQCDTSDREELVPSFVDTTLERVIPVLVDDIDLPLLDLEDALEGCFSRRAPPVIVRFCFLGVVPDGPGRARAPRADSRETRLDDAAEEASTSIDGCDDAEDDSSALERSRSRERLQRSSNGS